MRAFTFFCYSGNHLGYINTNSTNGRYYGTKPKGEEQNKSKDKSPKYLALYTSFQLLEAALGFFVACYTGGIFGSAENKNLK